MTVLYELWDHVRADKSGAASNKNSHLRFAFGLGLQMVCYQGTMPLLSE